MKVLAITNDNQLLKLLGGQLSSLGFKMDSFHDGDNIFDAIASSKPDVLLVDFILGDTNAAAICHQVTSDACLQKIPIVILSDLPDIDQLAAKLGSFSVIKKPVSALEIADELAEAVNQ